MSDKRTSSVRRPIKKGGKFFPALCNIIGTLILIGVIVTSIPLAVPRLLGYETYSVVSGSMEPALPIGSVVYVEHVEPDTVEPGDIIAFNEEGTVITHRVVENRFIEGEFVTKGDANEQEDFNNAEYRDFIGRVAYHIPVVGSYMMLYASEVGKIYLLVLAACGVMFNMLAGRIRRKQNEKFRRQLERYDKRQAQKARAELNQIRK